MKRKKKYKFDVFTGIMFVLVSFYVLCLLYLFFWGFLTAVKDEWDFVLDRNVLGFPNKAYGWKFSNFRRAIGLFPLQIKGDNYASFYQQFLYSFLYAFGVTVCSVFAKVFVAYACAKYEFKLKGALITINIIFMVLPIVGGTPSAIQMMRRIHIFDTYIGILFKNCCYHGMYFLIFYGTFKGLANGYSEAAQLDGAGHFSIFFKINIPLVANTILSVFILIFIGAWNTYEEPMMFLPSMPTVAYGLMVFSENSLNANAPSLMCGAYMICLPIIVIFCIFHKRIMGNLTVGGIKG